MYDVRVPMQDLKTEFPLRNRLASHITEGSNENDIRSIANENQKKSGDKRSRRSSTLSSITYSGRSLSQQLDDYNEVEILLY